MEVLREPAFREVGLGAFEGKTTDELQREYGEQFNQWLGSYHLIAPPGGENLDQAIKRMRDPLTEHIRTHGDGTVIVAHQAILMAMKAALSGDLSVSILATYKQANHEIDVWDFEHAGILRRIDIQAD